jgi:predicted nuclease of predicted toxin-antitoxin system
VPLPPLLADVNVAAQVVAFLRVHGVDVVSLYERGLAHLDDESILDLGKTERRFVLTHDSDFGRLAIAEGRPIYGVLFLRPGDDPPDVVIVGLGALLAADVDWTPPLVAVFGRGRLRVRRPVPR